MTTLQTSGSGAGTAPMISVEFQYLDLGSCGRCQDTARNLEEALSMLEGICAATGLQVAVARTHVQSEEQARALSFVASPTIRVDGRDIHPELLLNRCRDCGTLCGCAGGVDCRLWRYRGETHTAAPVGLILEAILKAAYGGAAPVVAANEPIEADAPDNLRRFFGGMAARDGAQRCCDADRGHGCCG